MTHHATRELNILRAHAEIGAAHATVADERDGDTLGGIRGDREADPLRGENDRGVDADDRAVRVHQRATGVARVERRIGLNHVIQKPSRRTAHGAAQGTHDARGHGVLESVRTADRDGDLADPHA